jgi:hypothetical protein
MNMIDIFIGSALTSYLGQKPVARWYLLPVSLLDLMPH